MIDEVISPDPEPLNPVAKSGFRFGTKSSGWKRILPILGVLFLVGLIVAARRAHVSFDLKVFAGQVKLVSFPRIALSIALVLTGYVLRSLRWELLLRDHKKLSPCSLLGTQLMGFAAVGIFGRIADLSRPFLVARKTGISMAVQVAVYTVERMFDLGAAALIFSTALVLMPNSTPHHRIYVRVGVASLAGTLILGGFAFAVLVWGEALAAWLGRFIGRFAPPAGEKVRRRLLVFREGLRALSSPATMSLAGVLSIGMWLMIAFAYLQTVHAFVHEPTLATLPFARMMLLMGASVGSSVLQLPMLGWLTQIAALAATMKALFNTPPEAATACAVFLLIDMSLSVIPLGLLFARAFGIQLRPYRARPKEVEAV